MKTEETVMTGYGGMLFTIRGMISMMLIAK